MKRVDQVTGWVAVVMVDIPDGVPAVMGPYETKREAANARVRLRKRARQEYRADLIKTYVRESWRDEPI